ncbi:CHAT domain-containing protein [Streptomyces sp. NPDC014864]|uniref:CHAT domain-containing protein n=1 Tax=Streptomyces sp. NPDC014864 TaxID=3364924 RepID=UPI0036FAEFB8
MTDPESLLRGDRAPEPSLLPWLTARAGRDSLRTASDAAVSLSGLGTSQWPGLADAVAQEAARLVGGDASSLLALVNVLPPLLRHLATPSVALLRERADALDPAVALLARTLGADGETLSVRDLETPPEWAAATVAVKSGLLLDDALEVVEAWQELPRVRSGSRTALAFLLPLLVSGGVVRRRDAGPVRHLAALQDAALVAVADSLREGPQWRAAALITHVVPALPTQQRRRVDQRIRDAWGDDAWAEHLLSDVVWHTAGREGPAEELFASHPLGRDLERAMSEGHLDGRWCQEALQRTADAVSSGGTADLRLRRAGTVALRIRELGIQDHGASPEPPAMPPGPERFLNARMVRPGSREPLPTDRSLGRGMTYELRLDIGPLDPLMPRSDGLVPFPEDGLPPSANGHWLDVRTVGFGFTVAPASEHARLFLPVIGPSWCCPCPPDGQHHCDAGRRERFLHLTVTAPPVTGPARLGVQILYRGNVLQCLQADFYVRDSEEPGHQQSMSLPLVLAGDLRSLEALSPRDVSVVQMPAPDDAWHLIVNQAGTTTGQITVRPSLARGDLVEECRDVLTGVHQRRGPLGGRRNRLGPDNGLSPKEFRKDLARLATVGRHLWNGLFDRATDRRVVARALRAPRRIQAPGAAALPYIPWSLVYDLPYTGTKQGATYCRVVDELPALPSNARQEGCPYETDHPEPGSAEPESFLCPFGFWGMRHSIDAPPHREDAGRFVTETAADTGSPLMVAAIELPEPRRSGHRDVLEETVGPIGWADTGKDLIRHLHVSTPALLYLCCHCGRDPGLERVHSPCLMLPTPPEPGITPDQVRELADVGDLPERWRRTRPLVFINGCGTAAVQQPEMWLDFVGAFASLDAAGVVGTETEVEAGLAVEVAEHFWSVLLAGGTVGDALRSVRIRLLRKNNLLGLTYTAHCFGDLRLRTPRADPRGT